MITIFTRLVWFFLTLVIPVVADPFRTASASPQRPSTGQLVIRLTGLGAAKAPVRIAVYDSEPRWLDEPSALYRTILDAESPQWEWTIAEVAYGDYAVAAFQDRNRNDKLDRHVLGMPKEPYGFSNDARGVFGPASWKEARVRVMAPVTEVSFELK